MFFNTFSYPLKWYSKTLVYNEFRQNKALTNLSRWMKSKPKKYIGTYVDKKIVYLGGLSNLNI